MPTGLAKLGLAKTTSTVAGCPLVALIQTLKSVQLLQFEVQSGGPVILEAG